MKYFIVAPFAILFTLVASCNKQNAQSVPEPMFVEVQSLGFSSGNSVQLQFQYNPTYDVDMRISYKFTYQKTDPGTGNIIEDYVYGEKILKPGLNKFEIVHIAPNSQIIMDWYHRV